MDIAEGNSDIPGQTVSWLPGSRTPNCKDQRVNGRCDLTDFFPVWLDLSSALMDYPPTNSGVVYRLSQRNEALKFVYTNLTCDTAGEFLIAETNTYGVAVL